MNLLSERHTGLLRRNAATKSWSKMPALSLEKEGKRNERSKVGAEKNTKN